jgi:hypothetical protein
LDASAEGELFTVTTGFITIAASALMQSFFCQIEKLRADAASRIMASPVKKPVRLPATEPESRKRRSIATERHRSTIKATAHESESIT